MSVSDGDAGKGKGPGSETSSFPSATSLDVQTTMPSSRQIIATLFARFFILPTCIFYAVLTRSGVSFPAHESALLYVSLIVVNIYTAAGYTRWKHARSARRLGASLVPRVTGKWPGNVDIMYTFVKRFLSETPGLYWDELALEYGTTFDLGLFWGTVIFSKDTAVMKRMLTGTSFANYGKGEWFQSMMRDFLGSGIFNSDHDEWKAHRAMTRPFFAKELIGNFETFARHSDHLIQVIDRLTALDRPTSVNKNGAIDIQDLFGRFTLDAATEFLMAGSISSLSDVDPIFAGTKGSSSEFLDAFNAVQHNVYHRAQLGDLWPMNEIFTNKNSAPMAKISPVIDRLISFALSKSRSVTKEGDDTGTLLDHLICETRDPKVLKDQILNILLAARDTTMSTLSSSMYTLARNPHILAKLRAEVLSVVGNGEVPDYEQARGMKYLRAFLNEVLRLFPPVPFNMRSSVGEDVVMAEGKALYIPPETRVSFGIFNLQRRTDLWGPDAMVFDPDRWLDDRTTFLKANPFIFTPFSAGPRICLGQNFAYNEASFALIRLLQTYDKIDLAMDVQPMESVFGDNEVLLISQITLMFKTGLWVRLRRET